METILLSLAIGFILGSLFTTWGIRDNMKFYQKLKPDATKEETLETFERISGL